MINNTPTPNGTIRLILTATPNEIAMTDQLTKIRNKVVKKTILE